MRPTTKIFLGGVFALTLSLSAGASFADTVASAHETGSGTDIKWVKSGGTGVTAGTGGHLYSGASGATAATAVPYAFDFNFEPLAGAIGSLSSAKFLLDATAAAGNAATGTGTSQQQQGLNGDLSLTYTGVTPLVGCIHVTCTNLLTAHFTDAWLVGGGAFQPGTHNSTINFTAFNDPTVPGSSATFTSDFADFSDYTDLAFSFALASPTTIGHVTGKALTSFNASSAGTFEGMAPIPEPAVWTLMIIGFGGAGAMLRHRRAATISA